MVEGRREIKWRFDLTSDLPLNRTEIRRHPWRRQSSNFPAELQKKKYYHNTCTYKLKFNSGTTWEEPNFFPSLVPTINFWTNELDLNQSENHTNDKICKDQNTKAKLRF
jgi:hypothetical protein